MKPILSIAALTTLCAAAMLPLSASAQTEARYATDRADMVRVQHGYDDRADRYDHRYDAHSRRSPPPPRHERVRRAPRDHVWQPGHWVWQGTEFYWAKGQWMRARPGYVYVPKAWVQRDGRYFLRLARWDRIDDRYDNRHDDERRYRDRDGVRDRYDRDLDNDGIGNRRDRDVDGDGVRNAHDRRPDNRNQY